MFLSLLLFCIAVSASERIVFDDRRISQRQGAPCVPIQDCPVIREMAESNPAGLAEFDDLKCGFEGGEQTYRCPQSNEECDCQPLADCARLKKYTDEHDFAGLRRDHRQCGFEGAMPKFCCPAPTNFKPKKATKLGPRVALLNETAMALECGAAVVSFIRGGQNALAHEYPWMTALVYKNLDTGTSLHLCGGALITAQDIVTAAHCLSSQNNHSLSSVKLGHSDLTHPDIVEVDIVAITLHDSFSLHPVLKNDIAVIHLKDAVEFNDHIKPICMPPPANPENTEDDQLRRYELFEVAGWGVTDNATNTDLLQKLEVNATENASCESSYRQLLESFRLSETQICARGALKSDSCKGDSGGPLMGLTKTNKYEIVGVTSFGTNRCDSSVPGVYTRVAHYVNWIKESINSV